MAKRELTRDERDLVQWYAHCINGRKHNSRMLEDKFLSDKQAEKQVLELLSGEERERFLQAKRLARG